MTNEKAFHILLGAVWELYLKDSLGGEVRVADDRVEIRLWLNNFLDRICKRANA